MARKRNRRIDDPDDVLSALAVLKKQLRISTRKDKAPRSRAGVLQAYARLADGCLGFVEHLESCICQDIDLASSSHAEQLRREVSSRCKFDMDLWERTHCPECLSDLRRCEAHGDHDCGAFHCTKPWCGWCGYPGSGHV